MPTPNIVNKPVLLHGIGSGILKTVSGKVLEFKTSQSMKLNVTASTEDVYGGDGLFPLYTYLTQKEGSIEIQDADFKLSQLAGAQQVEYYSANQKRLHNVLVKSSDTTLPGGTYSGVEVVSIVAPNGDDVSDKVTIDAVGAITVASGYTMDGEYSVWFKSDETTAVTAEMLKNAMPEVAELNWKFTTESQDGEKYQIDIHARRVRSNGEFNIETARDSASTPTLTLNILDPGTEEDDFASITVSKLGNTTTSTSGGSTTGGNSGGSTSGSTNP
jgi:hypothetical protein